MATSQGYLDFILEQLSNLDGITHRQMMGEYIIYYNGKIAAYICDDRLLVKILPSTVAIMPNAPHEPPYSGAKDMLLVENVDDRGFLKMLFRTMEAELPMPKPRKKKA